MRQAAGGVFEPLARPDLLITDAERASVTSSRRKDRDLALIGTCLKELFNHGGLIYFRHNNCDSVISIIITIALRLKLKGDGTPCLAGSALELFSATIPNMFSIPDR